MTRRVRHITYTALCVWAILMLVAASSGADIDGATVLEKMLEAEGNVVFTAHQVTTLAKGPPLTSEQIVYRAGFKGMRTEYIAPPLLRGEIMADDGHVLAHFMPRAKVVKLRPSRLAALRQRTAQAAEAFKRGYLKVELVGRDRIAGRTAYVIEVKPARGGGGPARKFWVDADKWAKLKTEDIAPGGTVLSTSYYTRISFVNAIPDEKFRFQPPSGVRTEHMHRRQKLIPIQKARELVRFQILEPDYVPPGFRLAGAAVIPFRGSHLVGLRYTDGVSSFSLFETPERILSRKFLERLHKGPVRPGKGVYSWRRGRLNLTIVGHIPSDQIRKIASSVGTRP